MPEVIFKLDESGKWWRQVDAWEVEAAMPNKSAPEPVSKPKKKGRVMSQAERAAQSKRMKAYWAAKRKAAK